MCKTCEDEKYLRYDVPLSDPRFDKVMPCPDCNKITVDRMSGLNPDERRVTLDDLKTQGREGTARMIQAARIFIASPVGFLSIHGGFGIGKTTAIMGIVNALIDKGIEARYLTAAQLLAYMRDAFNADTKVSDYDRVHELAVVPVLCIDEMDKLRNTEYAREIQQELINIRYREAGRLGTVLAWNGGLDALDFPAIRSRLQEFIRVENTDKDVRPLIGGMK